MSIKDKVIDKVCTLIEEGRLSNEDIVGIIKVIGTYANIQSITAYAKTYGLTYNGAKGVGRVPKDRKIIYLFGKKMVMDSDLVSGITNKEKTKNKKKRCTN
jgi:hypothetical protein